MNPILFAENSTVFTSNGIGRLSPIDCVVTEERNGIYELEMTLSMDSAHYSDIGIRSIIVAKPSANASIQPFRIYQITRPIYGKVKIYAQHLSYDLSKNTCMPFDVTASGSACNSTLQGLKSNAVESCPFTFWTDVTTVASYSQKTPSSIRQRLGGITGSVIDQFGGEYEFDKYAVKLYRNRGTTRDITLRYGKNIIDLNQEENIANTVTGVVPFWTNIDNTVTVTLPERVIYSSHASQYSHRLTVPLDLSSEWEDEPSKEALRAAATVYVNKEGFGVPKVSTKVNFVNLADTEEYKDVLPLQEVNLCDTIKVQFEALGIDTTAKIVKTEYNVLAEKYESIEIGSLKSNLASTITDIEASMARSISETGDRVFAEVGGEAQDLINNATAWLTSGNGYVVAVKNSDGSWKELLFMDTDDIDTAINVLRINENGLGFSKTGVGGPYYQGWTLDGKILIGGSNASGLTVYKYANNTSQVLFQIYSDSYGRAHITWDTENSSMDADGLLTAVNMVLTGGTLTLGKDNDGLIEMYDSNSRLRGKWSKTEFILYDGYGTYDRNIIFKADEDGAMVKGSLDTGSFTIEDQYIKYDRNTFIDMEGGGDFDGIHLNGDRVVFSVDELGVTNYRGSTSVRTGFTGSIEYVSEIHDNGGGSIGWSTTSFDVVNGLIVN